MTNWHLYCDDGTYFFANFAASQFFFCSFLVDIQPYSESKLEQPDFRYWYSNSSLSFVRLSWGRITDTVNLQLTGKISFKLDSNSRLLLEYGRMHER